jgi:PAS domain S-box-containing protein
MLLWSLVPVVVCIVAFAVGRATYDNVQATTALTTRSRVTLSAASQLLQSVVDLETGVRGFALTADPAFLKPYNEGRPEVNAELARLRELVHDRPEQYSRVQRVAAIVEDWNQAFAQPVIGGVQAGQDVRGFIRQGIGKRRIDLIREEMGAFEADEEAALAARVEQDAVAWRLAGFVAGGVLLGLLLSSFAALVIGRRIAQSVGAFAQAAGEIAAGSLETRLPDVGRNEIAATGRAINQMAAALSEAHEELLAQNDSLVEQVREAERARAEVRGTLDATSDAIVLVGPDRRFLSVNRQFDELFGLDPGVLIGRRFGDSAALFDQIFEEADSLRAVLEGTASDTASELSHRVKQQWPACRDLALHSRPVRSESGEFLGRLYVFRDVTYEARLDEQRRQLEAERARAAEVQADLLPRTAPALPGFELAGHCIPALQVGGDFFDWYTADGLVWLTLGDVMGKGMAAALLMATVRATLRAGTRDASPSAALGLAQAVLGEDLGHRDSYVTLFHAVFEPSTGRLDYVDAGHGHVVIRRADGRIERLARRSFPLGMPFATEFDEGHVVLGPDDALILYSDGLVDAAPGFDVTALADRLDGAESAEQMVRSLIELGAGSSTPRSVTLADDLTVVVLRASEVEPASPAKSEDQDRRELVGPGIGRRSGW